jgi:hypothetical protein
MTGALHKYSAQVDEKRHWRLPFEEPKSQDIVIDIQMCLMNIFK